MDTPNLLLLAAAATGLTVALLTFGLLSVASKVRPTAEQALSHFEKGRRVRMREGSGFYKSFEGWIETLGRRKVARLPEDRLKQIAVELKGAGVKLPWLPEEHLAVIQIQSI